MATVIKGATTPLNDDAAKKKERKVLEVAMQGATAPLHGETYVDYLRRRARSDHPVAWRYRIRNTTPLHGDRH
jgi:hypothetical protein